MKRLTLWKSLEWLNSRPKDYVYSDDELRYIKLGKLENIADLCEKITKLPIYQKQSEIIYQIDYRNFSVAYNFLTNCIEVYDCYGVEGFEESLPVDKYGIDWAFTEEELIND